MQQPEEEEEEERQLFAVFYFRLIETRINQLISNLRLQCAMTSGFFYFYFSYSLPPLFQLAIVYKHKRFKLIGLNQERAALLCVCVCFQKRSVGNEPLEIRAQQQQ